MENIYLTFDLKQYYLKDFNKLISTSSGNSFGLDSGLAEILKGINKNPIIQTIFSKRYIKNDEWQTDFISYLEVAYFHSVEENIFSQFESFKSILFTKNIAVIYQKNKPTDNLCCKPNSDCEFGWKNNPDYFRVNHIHFGIDSANIYDHDYFWNLMKNIF